MTLFYAAVLLGALIFVHEFGHFLLAKLLGVKVLKFSLGFGPKVVGRTYGETEYLISAVPLGGYVKMLGQADTPQEEEEIPEAEKHRAYNYQPVWKRFSIVFVGPLFNLFFAVFIFFFIFLRGVPVPYPDIGSIQDNSPASRAGLMTGDRVMEINGKVVQSFNEIDDLVIESQGQQMLFKIKREGRIIGLSVTPEKKVEKTIFGENRKMWDIGAFPLLYPVVGGVVKGSRAQQAGILKGDTIAEIEGTRLKTWQDMTEVIHNNPERPLRFKIQREGRVMEFTITPEKSTFKTPGGDEKIIGLIGIKPAGNDFIKKFNPAQALFFGSKKTWDISVITIVSIVKLIERVIPADTIGGPIMIAQMAGEQASQGAMNFFTLMAVISINLGVLNLLPIPILDGGHLLFLGIEFVRRKPASEKVVMVAQRVGLAILVTLMVFALYNDIIRWITGKMLP